MNKSLINNQLKYKRTVIMRLTKSRLSRVAFFIFMSIAIKGVSQPTLFQKVYDLSSKKSELGNSWFINLNDNRLLFYGSNYNNHATYHCTDSLGNVKWAKEYTVSEYDATYKYDISFSIKTAEDKVASIGKVLKNGDDFGGMILKADTAGNVEWTRVLEVPANNSLYLNSIAEDETGNIYVVGYQYSSISGKSNGILVKLDKNGSLIFQKSYTNLNNSNNFRFQDIKLLSSTHFLISSTSGIHKVDHDGSIVWSKQFAKSGSTNQPLTIRNCYILPDGEIIVNASGYYVDTDAYLFKTDGNNEVKWAFLRDNPWDDYHHNFQLLLSPDNQTFYSGGKYGNILTKTSQLAITKFNVSDGAWLWTKGYGGECNDEFFGSLKWGSNNTLYLSGASRDYGLSTVYFGIPFLPYGGCYLVRSDNEGYTSCIEDEFNPEFQSVTLVENDFNVNTSELTFNFSSLTMVSHNLELAEQLICSSANPIKLDFEASDFAICKGTCIDFSSDKSVLHKGFMVIPGDYDPDQNNYNFSEGYKYKWSFPGATPSPDKDTLKNPTGICYPDTGKYDVTLTITYDCRTYTFSKPNYITVGEKVSNIDVTSSKTTICFGDSATLTASGASAYKWSPKSSLSDSIGSSVVAKPTQTTTYTVVGGEEGCSATKEITINVNPTQVTANAGIDTAICSGESIVLKGIETGATSFQWNNGQTTKNITVTPINTTDYIFTAINGNCESKDSVKVTVNPIPSFSMPAEVTIEPLESTTLVASGGGTYLWSPATGLSCADCASPTASPSQTTEYCVVVTNTEGCEAKQCTRVKLNIHCGDLFIPTGFSPNGDNINDKLEVKINPECVTDYSFMIFDRWGEKVFETTKITDSWDGKYDGKELDNAVFVYYAKLKLIDSSEPIVKKGNVSIIR